MRELYLFRSPTHGLDSFFNRERKNKYPNAQLQASQVRQIREAAKVEDFSIQGSKLAFDKLWGAKFLVRPAVISGVRTGRTYNHVK